jgi:hypothetical protein
VGWRRIVTPWSLVSGRVLQWAVVNSRWTCSSVTKKGRVRSSQIDDAVDERVELTG